MGTNVVAGRELQRNRPSSVSWAALLAVGIEIGSIPFGFTPGADMPGFAVVIGIVVTLLTIVAAWGMWNLRRWGAIVMFVVTLLDTITAIPGLFMPPNDWILAELIIGVPLSVAVLVLIALPASRRAFRAD
jgi:hypothetical protein